MKRYLKYELKRNLLPIVIFTVIACAITLIVNVLSDTYIYGNFYTNEGEFIGREIRVYDSLIMAPTVILCALCVIVPIMQFSYRMTSRGTDLWFAMPIERQKLVLTRIIAGLIMVAIPYTACYWLNFIVILCRENYYALYGYPLYYLATLLPAAIMFGFYSFIFSRANTIPDGILFMLLWSLVLLMPLFFVSTHNLDYSSELTIMQMTPFGAIAASETWFNALICGEHAPLYITSGAPAAIVTAWLVPLGVVMGAGSYAGLLLTARGQKSENSEQLSSSLWGYRTLIPYYVFSFMASMEVLDDAAMTVMYSILMLIGGYVLFIAFRRSFKVKLADILSVVIAYAAGFAVSVIVYYATLSPAPVPVMPELEAFMGLLL